MSYAYRQGQQQAGAALCTGHMGLPTRGDFEEQEHDYGPPDSWEEWHLGYCEWMAHETGIDPRGEP